MDGAKDVSQQSSKEGSIENMDNISSSDSDGFDSSYSDLTSPTLDRKLTNTQTSVDAKVTVEISAKNMMHKVGEYLNNEITATCEDYKLLQTLNQMTITKYDEMTSTTKHLVGGMEDMNEKYKSLLPYLSQIDLLQESIVKLEQTAYKLDGYSKHLEAKFKSLDKK